MLQTTHAQQQSYQNLYFIRKGDVPVFHKPDYELNRTGFYMYRNCIYQLTLKNKLDITIKVLDIRHDSIYYVRREERGYYNADKRVYNDTLTLHPSQIRGIRYDGFFLFTDHRMFRVGHG